MMSNELNESRKKRVLKLTTGELVIGDSEPQGENIVVYEPYSIYETFDEETQAQKVALMPYEFPYLMEAMHQVTLRGFDIMWNKRLDEFPVVEAQYVQATSGLATQTEERIIL